MKKLSSNIKISNLNMRIGSLLFSNFSNNTKVNKTIFLNLCKGKFNKFNIYKNYVNKKIYKFKTKL